MNENGRPDQVAGRGRRTRRQLLTGGAAAVGALAATSLSRGAPAMAANGDNVILGQLNQASSNTAINDSGGDTTFSALATSTGTALEGDAVDGVGVSGSSETGIGVAGASASKAGSASAVFGELTSSSPGAFSAGVRGQNDGTSGDGIGVYGSQAGSGWGVYGTTPSGVGVKGFSNTGVGVEGTGSTGVHGSASSSNGVGVLAENAGAGLALNVMGMAAFSRSGVATVPAHRSQVTHRIALTSGSFVLATIQGNVQDLYVRGVTTVAGSHGAFTIHLSKAVGTKTKVAWFVVN